LGRNAFGSPKLLYAYLPSLSGCIFFSPLFANLHVFFIPLFFFGAGGRLRFFFFFTSKNFWLFAALQLCLRPLFFFTPGFSFNLGSDVFFVSGIHLFAIFLGGLFFFFPFAHPKSTDEHARLLVQGARMRSGYEEVNEHDKVPSYLWRCANPRYFPFVPLRLERGAFSFL